MKRTLLFLVPVILLAGCTTTPSTTTDEYNYDASSSAQTQTSSTTSSSISSMSANSSKAAAFDGTILKGKHYVTLKTTQGDITLELNADAAPKTVTNFVALAQSGYYDGVTFHRVIPGFMIQGGDPNGDGRGGRSIFGDTFEDEIDASSALYKTGYKAGVVAMANRGPDTNGSQFFIMDADYPLSPDYTIFGKVTSGQNVVEKIANVPRDANDMPKSAVTFTVEVK